MPDSRIVIGCVISVEEFDNIKRLLSELDPDKYPYVGDGEYEEEEEDDEKYQDHVIYNNIMIPWSMGYIIFLCYDLATHGYVGDDGNNSNETGLFLKDLLDKKDEITEAFDGFLRDLGWRRSR